MDHQCKSIHKYSPHKNHCSSSKKRDRHRQDELEKSTNNNNNKTIHSRPKSCPPARRKSTSNSDKSEHSSSSKPRKRSPERSLTCKQSHESLDKDKQIDSRSSRKGSASSSIGQYPTGIEKKLEEAEILALSLNNFGREKTVGTIESLDIYHAKKEVVSATRELLIKISGLAKFRKIGISSVQVEETGEKTWKKWGFFRKKLKFVEESYFELMEEYEKKKKKKKEKLRTEIDELRKKRDQLKVSMKLDFLTKETELLEKQKELNEFEERLLSRQEEVYEREKSLHDTLEQLEQSEAAMDRRKSILQRKQEELTKLSHVKDIDSLHQQYHKRKDDLNSKNEVAGSSTESTQEIAQLNWDFLRSVFQDRAAMVSTELKAVKVKLLKAENQLRDKTLEAEKIKEKADNLETTLKKKDKKIKEIDQHLTLILEEQRKKKEANKEKEKHKEPKGYFNQKNTVNNNNNGDIEEDKYVSQACNIM